MDLNGNAVLNITKPVYYVFHPYENCSNPENNFVFLIEFAVAISAIL